jgi:hypothetical protein
MPSGGHFAAVEEPELLAISQRSSEVYKPARSWLRSPSLMRVVSRQFAIRHRPNQAMQPTADPGTVSKITT